MSLRAALADGAATAIIDRRVRRHGPEPVRVAAAVARLRSGGDALGRVGNVPSLQDEIFAAIASGTLARLSRRKLRDGAVAFFAPPRPIGRDAAAAAAFLAEVDRRRQGTAYARLIGAYLDGFRTDDQDIQRLAKWLDAGLPRWHFRRVDEWRKAAEAWLLFDPANGPVRLAERMLNSTEPPLVVLRAAGLTDVRAGGPYATEAFASACALTGKYRWGEAFGKQVRLIEWASAEGAFAYPAAWEPYALALLDPWVTIGSIGEIRPQQRKILVAALVAHGGDPRTAGARWVGLRGTPAFRLFLDWLSRTD